MNVYHHPCGCLIERLYSFESGIPLYTNVLNQELYACPQCGHTLIAVSFRSPRQAMSPQSQRRPPR